MSAVSEVALYLVQTAVGLYLLIMLLRFLVQLVKADFYNPITQFLVRATNPLVLPLRKLLPAYGRFDPASLLWSILIQLLGIIAVIKLGGWALPPLSLMVAWSFIAVLGLLVKIYFFALLGMIILSWVAPGSSNPAVYLIYEITEPVAAPVRRMLPAMGGIDFSPILLFVLINVIDIVLQNIAVGLGLHPSLVLGL